MTLVQSTAANQLEALSALHAGAFARGWSVTDLAGFQADPNALMLVAMARDGDTQPAGFALARHAAGEAELLTIAVAAERRGRGIARHLLQAMAARLAALGVAELFLEVDATNAAARRLYAGFGFRQIGTRRGYYATSGNGDAISMRCALAAIDAHCRRLHNQK